MRQGRGVANTLPILLLAGLVVAALLKAALLLMAWMAAALLIAVLICNPWRLLDGMMDGKTRGLWATALGMIVGGTMIPGVPLRARAILLVCSVPLFWLGGKIRQPAPPPPAAPALLIQSEEGDRVIGQLASKVTGRGLQHWQDGGKAVVRAVMHQTYTEQITTEWELDRVGRVSYAVGYERAKTQEAALEAKIKSLQDTISERDSQINVIQRGYAKYNTPFLETAEARRELAEANAFVEVLQERVRELEAERASREMDMQVSPPIPPADRDDAIREAVASGMSFRQAAAQFSLSKSRVEQICKAG